MTTASRPDPGEWSPPAAPRKATVKALAVKLAAIEVWPVGLAVAAAMVSQRLLPWAAGVAALFWALRWAARGRLSVRTPADGPLLVLAGMIPVTLWATALPETTLPQALRLLTGIALYYAIANWAGTRSRVRWLALGAVAGGLLLALSVPASVRWSPSDRLPFLPEALYTNFSIALGDTANPNVMAGFLALFLPLALAPLVFWPADLAWRYRLLAAFSGLAVAAALLLTQSRGALLAAGAALCTLAVLRWRYAWAVLAILLVAGGVAFQAAGPAALLDGMAANQTLGGLEGRLEVWSRAIYMLQDFPFTGIGMGAFTRVADTLYPFFLAPPGKIAHAHNLFLQVGVDLGIPGLVAWLAAWLAVCASAWGLYRHGRARKSAWVSGLGAGLLASQVALAVHGLTDAVTWGMVRPAPLVWGLWGLAVAGWHVYRSAPDA